MFWAECGEIKLWSGQVSETRLMRRDRKGGEGGAWGGSACTCHSIVFHFTHYKIQCQGQKGNLYQQRPIKAGITVILTTEENTPRRINELQDSAPVQPISPIGNERVMGQNK